MGPRETELRHIAAAGQWRVDELAGLGVQIQALSGILSGLSRQPGWEGSAAEAAVARFGALDRILTDVIESQNDLRKAIGQANVIWGDAVDDLQKLPDTFIPEEVYDAIAAGGDTFPFMGWYFDAQESSLGLIESMLGTNREQNATGALTRYRDNLVDPAIKASTAANALPYIPPQDEPLPDPSPDVPEIVYGPPAGSRGPVPPGLSTGFPPYQPPGFPPPPPHGPPGPPDDGPGPVPDDPGPGYIPSPPGPGVGGPGLIGGPGGPGVGVGAGVGAAALAAGVGAKALGLGAGGLGAAGAAARPGAGGLLGGGGATAGGAGAGAGRGNATRGGSRGLLGGGGAQGGAGAPGAGGRDEKKRATGRGLGGAIAPHLEDDENYVPRGAGTRAGGRDDAEPAEPATD